MITSVFTDEISRDLRTAREVVQSLGIPRIELRGMRTGRVPEISEGELRELLDEMKKGLPPVGSISPGICKYLPNEPDVVNRTHDLTTRSIEFAQCLGASKITVFGFRRLPDDDMQTPMPPPAFDLLKQVAKRISAAGLTVAIENWQSSYFNGASSIMRTLDQLRDLGVKCDLDPANAYASGGNATIPDVASIGPWISAIHVKDIQRVGAHFAHAPFGTGRVDWKRLLRELREHGIDANYVLESHATGSLIEKVRDDLSRFNEMHRTFGEGFRPAEPA